MPTKTFSAWKALSVAAGLRLRGAFGSWPQWMPPWVQSRGISRRAHRKKPPGDPLKVTIKEGKKVEEASPAGSTYSRPLAFFPRQKGSVINIGVPQQKELEAKATSRMAITMTSSPQMTFSCAQSRAMTAKALPAPAQPEILEPEEDEESDE